MKHLFVPYELALKLKEKEFNESCFQVYDSPYSMIPDCEAGNNSTNVDAPLYQQVQDWFREKHNIHIWVRKSNNSELFFYRMDYNLNYNHNERFNTYYEALTKAIEEAIKLI